MTIEAGKKYTWNVNPNAVLCFRRHTGATVEAVAAYETAPEVWDVRLPDGSLSRALVSELVEIANDTP